jgi:hypothetical protein
VISPRTTLYVSGKAEANAAVESSVHGFMSATAGLRYDGQVHPIGAFDNGFDYSPPAPSAKGSLGGRVIPSVEFLLYGQVGPRFDLSTGLQLDADPSADPWWTLTAPIELSAGLDVPNFGSLSIPQRTVYSTTLALAHANNEEQPPPTEGPSVQRAHISWDTDSTDVDLHVWDEDGNHAWYSDRSGVPGAELSDDDTDGFGPEWFFDDPRGRTFTYGLCYFNDSGVGPTTIQVDLTDPNGSVRHLTETLDGTGDSVLIGSSPSGSSFVPEDGWCNP